MERKRLLQEDEIISKLMALSGMKHNMYALDQTIAIYCTKSNVIWEFSM